MAIDVGHILDKYELLEEVGQGGMAVVYRGFDRSLRREVAIKVLHKHLAAHQEARDRFEREAHAVAKLRHENILEIFDFSGVDSPESYIVTEFIDGQTLRQFVAGHPIKYPEIGALLAAQVCKALNHAHGIGILHRDIKPENIMIRNDGVVKLMDFGIAQMIDLQRMTVTGQLLGSPAYMSPEHVEGRPLDFRTDVFAVGILLYQLVVGDLPFQGRNPHEILKRIAECRYRPAHQANPLVGKELDRIISRALARAPDDRFPDISEMLTALEQFLAGCELNEHAKELQQYFAAPASYEMALKSRLLDSLTRRGKKLLDENRALALEQFNRVLTLDPDNAEVLTEIDRLSRRQRGTRIALALVAIAAVGGLAYAARGWVMSDDDGPTMAAAPIDALAPLAPMLPPDAGAAVAETASDAAVTVAVESTPDAAVKRVAVRPRPRPDRPRPRPAGPPDAGPAPAPATRSYTLTVSPLNSEYRLEGGRWTKINGRIARFEAPLSVTTVEVRNDACCQSTKQRIAEAPGGVVNVTLGWLPAKLTPECKVPNTTAQIDGRSVPLGRATAVPIESSFGDRTVEVAFFTDDGKITTQRVKLTYRKARVVRCDF